MMQYCCGSTCFRHVWYAPRQSNRISDLSSCLIINRTFHLRNPRGIAVVLLMLTVIFGGLLHTLTNISQVDLPTSAVVLTSVDTSDGHSDKGAAAEHQCHGCFSVSISAPSQPPATVELGIASFAPPQVYQRDRAPKLDTPPPKFLT